MHSIIALLVAVVLYANAIPAGSKNSRGRLVDLTHPFDESTLGYPGLRPYDSVITDRRYTENGYWLQVEDIWTATHIGTHMDAPCHIVKGQWTLEDIPIDRFIAPAAVVDISSKTLLDRDANLEVKDLVEWERRTNKTLNGTIVLVNTGWSPKWRDPKEFIGTDDEDVSKIHFPGVSPAAAEWIEKNRAIYGLGIDTTSLDSGRAKHRKAHQALFRANIYGLENVNFPHKLPDYGVTLYILPMRLGGACGAPTRIVALIPYDVPCST